MKVVIESDERYPEYFVLDDQSLVDKDDEAVEVDDETLARWRDVVGKYEVVQSEMATAWKRATS